LPSIKNLEELLHKTKPKKVSGGGFSFLVVYGKIYPMLKIRLQRIGRKNDPHFRLIVTESILKPKTTSFNEIIGTYNVKMGTFEAKKDRVKHWIGVGAQVTPTVRNLLISKGIIEGKKVNVLPRKSPVKKEEKKA
jgi:small subunit ribosomal protein S16